MRETLNPQSIRGSDAAAPLKCYDLIRTYVVPAT